MDYLDRLDEEKIIYGEYPSRKHIENYEENFEEEN